MTLRARLTLGLLTIAAILVVPLLFATRSLGHLHSETRKLAGGDFAASLILGDLRDALNDLRSADLRILFVGGEQSRDSMFARIRHVERLADSLVFYGLEPEAGQLRTAMDAVASGAQAAYRAGAAGQQEEADQISRGHVVPAITRAEAVLVTAERALRGRTREKVQNAALQAKQGGNVAVIALALALVVAAIIAAKLTRSVSHPVQELEHGMRAVADGDFDASLSISPSRRDEFGRLAASFADMTRQLAELDKLKAEFVSVASHELKTPINVILGYTQLLQEQLYGPLTDKQRGVTDVLVKQTKTLSRLVKQLLDITRFEAGGGKLDVRPTELRGFLHNLEEAFQVLADQRGVRFQLSVDEQVPETVYWDADRMNEVLGNLLSNAFKFTERGGEVELTVISTDHCVQMDVHDTGAGIPMEQQPRIFEKFYQADNQPMTTVHQAGSGLGLAIARTIVEAHNGTISVDSTPGVGTTFTIILPDRAIGRRSSATHEVMAAELG